MSEEQERLAELKAEALRECIHYEGHADRLDYGWWERKRGHVLLPQTLGDKRNFVLHYEDLQAYKAILESAKGMLDTELEQVKCTMFALANGRPNLFDRRSPKLFTLSGVLESLVMAAKIKLSVMEWAVEATAKRLVRVPKEDQS